MTKAIRVTGWVALVVLLASTGALADRDDLYTPNILNLQEGQLYDRGDFWPDREFKASDLPRPGVTDVAQAFRAAPAPTPGPLATLEKSDFGGGNAIIGPAGSGTIYTPQQRAQRDIRKMIRLLD